MRPSHCRPHRRTSAVSRQRRTAARATARRTAKQRRQGQSRRTPARFTARNAHCNAPRAATAAAAAPSVAASDVVAPTAARVVAIPASKRLRTDRTHDQRDRAWLFHAWRGHGCERCRGERRGRGTPEDEGSPRWGSSPERVWEGVCTLPARLPSRIQAHVCSIEHLATTAPK